MEFDIIFNDYNDVDIRGDIDVNPSPECAPISRNIKRNLSIDMRIDSLSARGIQTLRKKSNVFPQQNPFCRFPNIRCRYSI